MSELATFTNRSTVTLVRYLPGPIERVWAYLTEPKLLAKWFSEGSVSDSVGGDVRFEMGASGRITVFQPPHVFEYTWNEEEAACGPVVEALVRWELAEDGNRVRLTLTHSRLPENELIAHGAGWHMFLERLQACANQREPQPIEARYAQLKAEYEKRFDHVS